MTMHPEERDLLMLLDREGWPIAVRLLYCDWLDEHGQPEQALAGRELALRLLIHDHRYRPWLPQAYKGIPPPLPAFPPLLPRRRTVIHSHFRRR